MASAPSMNSTHIYCNTTRIKKARKISFSHGCSLTRMKYPIQNQPAELLCKKLFGSFLFNPSGCLKNVNTIEQSRPKNPKYIFLQAEPCMNNGT